MSQRDYGFLAALALLALFIWIRDLSWVSSFDDTIPLLIALPLFVWLGWPWTFKKNPSPYSTKGLVAGILTIVAGIAIDSTLFLTIGWVVLLYTWLSVSIKDQPHLAKLCVLPFMAFPWISMDADRIGWWFRLTAAWVTAQFFALLNFNIFHTGTTVEINGLPLSIEAACAGLNTLQSMLLAGALVDYIILKDTNRFWMNLPFLFLIAWFANTVRVIAISGAALAFGAEFAMGAFHTWGAWIILMLMFGLCWFLFTMQEPKPSLQP